MWLDNVIQNLLSNGLEVFTHVSFGFGAMLLLLLFAVGSSILINIRASSVKRQLQEANAHLEPLVDEADFTEQYAELDGKLRGLPIISRAWEEFSETLLPPLDEIDDPEYRVYRNTKRPQTFFNRSSILSSVRPFIESERLIGIGLVLTFIGLVAALTQAAEGFQGVNEDIKASLEKLLSTAGAKFLASVGGLGGALIQSMIQSYISRQVSLELEAFNDKLESLLSFASQERIAVDHFGHAKRQTARLEEMSTEITLALGKQIEDALNQIPTQFTAALQPMQESFERVTEKLSTGSSDALQQMVTDFQSQLTGASNESMNSVVNQLEALSATLGTTATSMKSGNDELRAGLQEVISAMSNSSQSFQQGVKDSAGAATEQLTAIMERLESQQAQTSNAISSLIEQFTETTQSVNQQMRDSASSEMERLAGSMQMAVETIINNAEQSSSKLTSQIGDTLTSVSENTATKVSEIMGQTASQIDESISRISESIDKWKTATETTSRSLAQTNLELDRHNQGLQRAGSQIFEAGGAFSTASDSVKDAVQPLSGAAEKIVTSTSELARSASQLTAQITEASRVMTSAVETTSESLDDLKATWTDHSRHLQGADEQLENAFKQVTNNLAQSLDTLSNYNHRFSEKVGEALDLLGSIVQELSDDLAEFNVKK